MAALGGFGAAYIWKVEPDWLEVERVEIPLAGLPSGLDGLRIAQLSDLHAGVDLPPKRLDAALQTVARLEPDLLVVTRDWVTYDAADAFPAARAVAGWSPPLGTYAILGNHDHWTRAETVARAVQEAGITLLRNQRVGFSAGGETLWLAGVDHVWEEHHDLAGAPVVLLAHEPDYADTVAADGRVGLQL